MEIEIKNETIEERIHQEIQDCFTCICDLEADLFFVGQSQPEMIKTIEKIKNDAHESVRDMIESQGYTMSEMREAMKHQDQKKVKEIIANVSEEIMNRAAIREQQDEIKKGLSE